MFLTHLLQIAKLPFFFFTASTFGKYISLLAHSTLLITWAYIKPNTSNNSTECKESDLWSYIKYKSKGTRNWEQLLKRLLNKQDWNSPSGPTPWLIGDYNNHPLYVKPKIKLLTQERHMDTISFVMLNHIIVTWCCCIIS